MPNRAPELPSPKSWERLQRSYYDSDVAGYEEQRAARIRAYQRKAAILANHLRGCRRILEVGAGSGLVTAHLRQMLRPDLYVALDLSLSMTRRSRDRLATANVDYVVSDATQLALAGEPFDAIVGVDLIHHLSTPSAALREWRRVVCKGGKLAILESNPYHPVSLSFIGVEHEVRLFLNSPANLAMWAGDAGWRDVRILPTPTFTPSGPDFLAAALNAIDRVALRIPGSRWLCGLWLVAAHNEGDAE